jgi:hypothetical protein
VSRFLVYYEQNKGDKPMSYNFKAKCIKNEQSSIGSHVATLQGATGETATVPSTDMLCIVGKEYSVTVDGEFVPKPKPAPEPAKPPVAAAAVPAKPVEAAPASTVK